MKQGEIIEFTKNSSKLYATILKLNFQKIKILTENGDKIEIFINSIIHKSGININLFKKKNYILKSIQQLSSVKFKISKKLKTKKNLNILKRKLNPYKIKKIVKLEYKKNIKKNKKNFHLNKIFRNNLYFKSNSSFSFKKLKKNKIKISVKRSKYIKKTTEIALNLISKKLNIYSITNFLEIKNTLCLLYVNKKNNKNYSITTKTLESSKIDTNGRLFNFLEKIGIWSKNENTKIIKNEIINKFSDRILKEIKKIKLKEKKKSNFKKRLNFTKFFTLTIDGSDTVDFDDAFSIEEIKKSYILSIHISDVTSCIKKGDILDKVAHNRICSIYMPEIKFNMFPSFISENNCSLKKEKIRKTISTVFKINKNALIFSYKIIPSIIKIDKQINYSYTNKAIYSCKKIYSLHKIANKLSSIRIQNGAINIKNTETNIKINKNEPFIKNNIIRNFSQTLVSEIMILNNWITARIFEKRNINSIFRSQATPIKKILNNNNNSIFHIFMQKKNLKKLIINAFPKRHCILGVSSYTSSTSPIRKYSDIIIQRQIKSLINLKESYSTREIHSIIKLIINKATHISKFQNHRNRYWLLKYLEKKIGRREKAVILKKSHHNYYILIKKYMLECTTITEREVNLKPKDIIQITIQHANARNNLISIFIG